MVRIWNLHIWRFCSKIRSDIWSDHQWSDLPTKPLHEKNTLKSFYLAKNQEQTNRARAGERVNFILLLNILLLNNLNNWQTTTFHNMSWPKTVLSWDSCCKVCLRPEFKTKGLEEGVVLHPFWVAPQRAGQAMVGPRGAAAQKVGGFASLRRASPLAEGGSDNTFLAISSQ